MFYIYARNVCMYARTWNAQKKIQEGDHQESCELEDHELCDGHRFPSWGFPSSPAADADLGAWIKFYKFRNNLIPLYINVVPNFRYIYMCVYYSPKINMCIYIYMCVMHKKFVMYLEMIEGVDSMELQSITQLGIIVWDVRSICCI